jgi:serine/threonine protein kinase
MLSLKAPFHSFHDSYRDLMAIKLKGRPPPFPKDDSIPYPLWELVGECMALEPKLRPSATQIREQILRIMSEEITID